MKNFIKKLVCFRGIIFDNKAFYANAVVFLSFLAFSFLSFSILSPIISSDAATNTATDGNSVYSASFSIDDATPISVTPTALQAVYTGTSTMSYTNTCPYGMSVTLSSSSSDTNLTRNGTDSGTKTIPTISSGTSLSDYTWGYSLDDGATYNGIPGLSSPAIILSTSSANTTAATKDVVYGIKIDDQLPSGSYSSTVVYTLSVSPQCIAYNLSWDLNGGTAASGVTYPTSLNFDATLDLSTLTPTRNGDYLFAGWTNGTDDFLDTETAVDVNPENSPQITLTALWASPMQTFSCSNVTNIGQKIYLYDARDNNIYTVKKLKDGKCWMTENLRLINKTISSTDSNLPSGETYTVPASDRSSFTTSYNTNSAYLDSTYGGYYNFYTATAGWGTNSVTSGNSPKDICPKGWRLPTSGDSGEFNTLYGQYNSVSLMMNIPNFTLSGYVFNGSVSSQGSNGYFWSSTVYGANDAYSLDLNSSGVYPADLDRKYYGFSVRCVAEPTMQTFKSSMLKNAGDSMQLEDERDGNVYTVKKLKDGKVWMTENLRLINKTISSADSNLPSGETYTVPASDLSSFTTSYNTNSAYLDSTYGGYYNFYTATAGTGGSSLASGNAAYDICPKGWRLPTGGPSGEFNTLYGQYKSVALLMGDPNFDLSGNAGSGSVSFQGSYGSFWSSTVANSTAAYGLRLMNPTTVYPVNGYNKYFGFPVRCIAEDRTISGITYMQDMKPEIVENTPVDTAATLTDIRDNNTYTVRKLKDGKVWMTKNLRLINKTITSADSNVTSNFTIPASSKSGFNDAQNTNNAYVDSTYGGYYNFYTATAGTGGTSLTSGNAPSSICPKGWRLPTGGDSGEFNTLYGQYNSNALMRGEPNITLSGLVGTGNVINQGSYGFFWSSTVYAANYAYHLYLSNSQLDPARNGNKNLGYSVRCVAI